MVYRLAEVNDSDFHEVDSPCWRINGRAGRIDIEIDGCNFGKNLHRPEMVKLAGLAVSGEKVPVLGCFCAGTSSAKAISTHE
jgi:hypothetical protein